MLYAMSRVHGVFALQVLTAWSMMTGARGAGHESCSLPSNIRPIVAINGFGSGALFDSENGFDVAFPDLENDPTDPDASSFGNITADVSLSLKWSEDLVQEASTLVSESFPGEELPGSNSPFRESLLEASGQVVAIVAGWEAAVGDNTTLFFPVNYDWRRDPWEQATRVRDMVTFAKEETGCNPIIVSLSLGGLVTYTAFTRFGEEFAENVHAVLYAVVPFTPLAAGAAILTTGFPVPDPEPFTGETLFTYPSFWPLINPIEQSCVNAPEAVDGDPGLCIEGEIDTGVTCSVPECGRPDDFTDPEFYLPIDLLDPATHENFIIGLNAARALAGEPPVLSEEEKTHVEFVTQATARVQNGTIGPGSAAVAAIHPPAITLSMTLSNVTIPGVDDPFTFVTAESLECIPPEGETDLTGADIFFNCEQFAAAKLAPSDGLLPSASTFLLNGEEFGDKLQVLNATVPSDFWLQVIAADGDPVASPHATALFTSVTPSDTFVDCSEYSETVTISDGEYPALEDMLCSLVLQGNIAHDAGHANSPDAAAEAVEDDIADKEFGDDIVLADSAWSCMHGMHTLIAVSLSAFAVLAILI